MKVAEAMRRQFQTVGPAESVQAAAQSLAEGDARALLVVDDAKTLIGIVTERDITVRAVAEARSADGTTIGDIMSSTLFACAPDDDAMEMARAMRERQVEQAPVLEAGRLVGLLALADLDDPARTPAAKG